jgi:cellulose synthase/poly-beta-1,6-N-acetylglucosamine synthase-like glycosyltransferase
MHNEESEVARKIENLRALDYPRDRVQIIITSDGSTDRTVEIAKSFSGITVLDYPQQQGKPTALNLAAEQATNEILLFTDARQDLSPNAARSLVTALSLPDIGVASGLLVQDKDDDPTSGSGLYWTYEKTVRIFESGFRSVPGATGALYAVRRRDFSPMSPSIILDDVELPMEIVRKGLRCILVPEATAHDIVAPADVESLRKIRTLTGNFQLMSLHPWLLSPVVNPIFFEFFSHKVLRLVVPYALLVAVVTPFFMGGLYPVFGLLQVGGYLLALAGHYSSRVRDRYWPVNAAYLFATLNVAAVQALRNFLGDRYSVRWKRA